MIRTRADRIGKNHIKNIRLKKLYDNGVIWYIHGDYDNEKHYWKPSSHTKTKKYLKQISNKTIRAQEKEELAKTFEDAGNFKGNKHKRKFDYWWELT